LESRQLFSIDGFGEPLVFDLDAAWDNRSVEELALGDLNADGKPDLVAPLDHGSAVVTMLGDGAGTFRRPAVAQGTGNVISPASPLIVDWNQDGRQDVLVTYYNGDQKLLPGNGDGSLGQGQGFHLTRSYSIAGGDFNNDGVPDLVALKSSSFEVVVGLNNGSGGIGSTRRTVLEHDQGVGNGATLAVGDVNRDGDLDLLATNDADRNLAVLFGNGDGTFQVGPSYGAASGVGSVPSDLALRDLNADGKLDVVIVNKSSDSVSVGMGDGSGGFQFTAIAVGRVPIRMDVGDIEGDGDLDIVVANKSSDTISLLEGNGDGTFQLVRNFAAGPNSSSVEPSDVKLGDLDGDGILAGGCGTR